MIEFIKHIDTQLFLFLNGINSPFLDQMMYWISERYTWFPFYLILLIVLFKQFKIKGFYILLFVAVLIALSDKISVILFKDYFQRYRPCYNENIKQMVHLLNNNCGGQYGFVSSHASNTFALAVFLGGFFNHFYKYSRTLLLCWAAIVSYSRIYLGVHYPLDIIGGALLGAAIAYGLSKILLFLNTKFNLEIMK